MPLVSASARYFDEISRAGSIRRAAERLNVAASAVNRQLLLLEEELGVTLFERLPRGVRLTAAGEILINTIRTWRREEAQARMQLQEIQGLRRGHVRLGLMECLAADVVPDIIHRMQQDHPGVTVTASVSGTRELTRALADGSIDVALAFNVPNVLGVRIVDAVTVDLGAVTARDHPLTARPMVSLADCGRYPLILPDATLEFGPIIAHALNQAVPTPIPPVVSNSIQLMKAMVQRSDAVSFLTRVDVYKELDSGALAFTPIVDARIRPETLTVSIHDRTTVPLATSLLVHGCQAALRSMRQLDQPELRE